MYKSNDNVEDDMWKIGINSQLINECRGVKYNQVIYKIFKNK